jgi:hypothetical protein
MKNGMISRRKFIKVSVLGTGLASAGLLSTEETIAATTNRRQKSGKLLSRKIPVIAEVDVLVIGGSSGAVAAASEAKQQGASVFLVTALPYPGDDIAGCLNLWPDNSVKSGNPLFRSLSSKGNPLFPLHAKTVLEDALLQHDIPFLYGSCPVDLLYDNNKRLSGALISNRSGCQAIKAKVVIDASPDAVTAHIGQLSLSKKQEKQQYRFVVVGNTPKQLPNVTPMPQPVSIDNRDYTALAYTFEYPDAGNDFAALNRIEQEIRDLTWDIEQVDSADLLYYVPSQHIYSAHRQEAENVAETPIACFQPKELTNLYILSAYADISRAHAGQLSHPANLIDTGARVGKAAADLAASLPKPLFARAGKSTGNDSASARAYEINKNLRPNTGKGVLEVGDIYLPVLGEYDLVVLGGGTAGAPVAIGAARQGVKTLCLEYLHGLGGLTTLGLIGRYWDGFKKGFTEEIDRGVCAMAPPNHPRQKKACDKEWCSDWKMEWFRKEIRKAKGDIWFGVLGCGAIVERGKVLGVVIATPFGRGVVLSKITVDSTGSADIAIAAGADYDYTGGQTPAVQGAGLSKHDPDDFYNNTDWTFIDDTDVLDVTRLFVSAKAKYAGRYDIGKLPQTRERRRIVAEHVITAPDIIIKRRYQDTLSFHYSSFDTHGYTVDPLFTLRPPEKRHTIYEADVPLRTLLPKGLDGIIVTGLGTGAQRDAMPVIRMQPCLQNQGYAVGYLTATAIKQHVAIRRIDIKAIQRYLVSIGNLPERVLTDKETFPLTDADFSVAIETLPSGMKGLEALLTDTRRAIPLLKQAYRKVEGQPSAINYAHTLAMLGDATGLQAVLNEISAFADWDEGWAYTGMGQFGPCMSRLDSLIMAAGNTRKDAVLPVVIPLAQKLEPEHKFSHFRAIATAFETIGSKKAVPVLVDLLNKSGVQGHSTQTFRQARENVNNNREDTTFRNKTLKEIHLAQALYRCGDYNQLGASILKAYSNDLHNHYARHAQKVLQIHPS